MRHLTTRVRAACLVALITALPLLAHHGSSGYDIRNPVTLTGTVRSIEWVNPHSFMYLDVKTDNGAVVTWAVEGFPPNAMAHIAGLTRDNFKPGVGITVIGYLPRETALAGLGTYRDLNDALKYSPHAVDLLKTKHVLQAGEMRLSSGEAHRFGMGPAFSK